MIVSSKRLREPVRRRRRRNLPEDLVQPRCCCSTARPDPLGNHLPHCRGLRAVPDRPSGSCNGTKEGGGGGRSNSTCNRWSPRPRQRRGGEIRPLQDTSTHWDNCRTSLGVKISRGVARYKTQLIANRQRKVGGLLITPYWRTLTRRIVPFNDHPLVQREAPLLPSCTPSPAHRPSFLSRRVKVA